MKTNVDVFTCYESEVRSYCRAFPSVFTRAKGSRLYDDKGNIYLDFLCGAGSINYGHNNPKIKEKVMEYLADDGLVMGLDLHTKAKEEFIRTFSSNILLPRKLNYKMQFTSPTGTSVVESAIKLARKETGRENIIAFTNAYHGMTGVSLSLTGNKGNRQAISYSNVTRMPFDNYIGPGVDEVALYRKLLEDQSSGIDLPAAIILETVQGEGGINIARDQWLRDVSELAKDIGAILIVDDVQAGCGRTGRFFSFERAGIEPDIVCLSKSISGIGFPMALMLLKPELDVWRAGEDNGTFRGNNIAFVAATKMLEQYWQDFSFEKSISIRTNIIGDALMDISAAHHAIIKDVRGIGMMYGIEFYNEDFCAQLTKRCYDKGLIIERSGERDQVLKIMPALTINETDLLSGLTIIKEAIAELNHATPANDSPCSLPEVNVVVA